MTTAIYNVNKQIQSKNYIVDGDVDRVIEDDFFNQLKSMLNQNEHEDKHDNGDIISDLQEDDNCLLTKEPLHSVYIKLSCGHKFNYVPLYREVIVQKTIGMSPNGYYTSHSLKRNEIKCPYCRNIQDKLLPYLECDGVKKIYGVNYPIKLSMTSQPCMYSATSKKGKISTCKQCAIECYNGTYVCKKHYDVYITSPLHPAHHSVAVEKEDETTENTNNHTCGVILRYGKNKGQPCSNPSTCRVHLNHKNKNKTVVE